MTNHEKIHDRISNNPGNVRFDDAVTWLQSFGFIERAGKGSHVIFTHPEYTGRLTFQDVNGKVKAYQIKQAIKAIKEISHGK